MRLLFVCTQNLLRSPTAEKVFNGTRNIEAKSAGLSTDARRKVTQTILDWADLVFAMETEHLEQILDDFKIHSEKIVSLDIPDDFDFMQSELVSLLENKVPEVLSLFSKYDVIRMDDHGNKYVMRKGLSKENAEEVVREFEAHGHKQTYWVKRQLSEN